VTSVFNENLKCIRVFPFSNRRFEKITLAEKFDASLDNGLFGDRHSSNRFFSSAGDTLFSAVRGYPVCYPEWGGKFREF
jgi:hypothetical protein